MSEHSDLETLFDKLRIPKRWGIAKLIREFLAMMFLVLIVAILLAIIFGAQYASCPAGISVMDCFRKGHRSDG